MFHKPILVSEFLSFFENHSIRCFIDGTLGAGGHAKALLESHPEIEVFYGLDQDPSALEIARETLHAFDSKIRLIHGNFREIKSLVHEKSVDGIFLDIGVSSMQLDQPEKGFSFSKEGPLDMRMDATKPLDAAKVVNTFSEKELGRIFREFGEERKWRAAARTLVHFRKKRAIKTTTDLVDALSPVLGYGKRGKKLHPLTLVFQALRIFVNDELGAIQSVIPDAIDLLSPGGRMGIISFHSLEDRIVKHAFRFFASETKTVRILTKKPLTADQKERRENPRSRSAKMRFVEKL